MSMNQNSSRSKRAQLLNGDTIQGLKKLANGSEIPGKRRGDEVDKSVFLESEPKERSSKSSEDAKEIESDGDNSNESEDENIMKELDQIDNMNKSSHSEDEGSDNEESNEEEEKTEKTVTDEENEAIENEEEEEEDKESRDSDKSNDSASDEEKSRNSDDNESDNKSVASMKPEKEVDIPKRELPQRSTRGKRMIKLLGKALEEDEEFWGQEFFADEKQDESYSESEEGSNDVIDSDFEKAEEEEKERRERGSESEKESSEVEETDETIRKRKIKNFEGHRERTLGSMLRKRKHKSGKKEDNEFDGLKFKARSRIGNVEMEEGEEEDEDDMFFSRTRRKSERTSTIQNKAARSKN